MKNKVALEELLENIETTDVIGDRRVSVQGIITDSRQAVPGCLFVAIQGTQSDGHAFVDQAIEKGATVVIVEKIPASLRPDVVYVVVSDTSKALGFLSSNYFGQPSKTIKVIGITGTNGKTSVATLLFQLFRKLGYRCGLISTVQNQIEDEVVQATHTTPEAPVLHALLARMVEIGCQYAFMEVSSHAVVQQRIAGLKFAGAVFTNITHDHLDFHGSFDHYINAKKAFFDGLSDEAFALVNADDRRGSVMVQNTRAKVYTFSTQQMADFKAKLLASTLQGMQLLINGKDVWVRLIGLFNVSNLLAVYGTAVLLDEDEENVLTELSSLLPPPGRFEVVFDSLSEVTGIVDYAHTPDALENVLSTIAQLRTHNEKVITLVGCGGNRDRAKRPKMASIACRYSDIAIFTSDNSRNEDPVTIIEEMKAGVHPIDFKKTKSIIDRREAIRWAVKQATKGDIILVAGKGHETYQEVKGVRTHFDDKEELKAAFNTSE